jgi:hypothetical protein
MIEVKLKDRIVFWPKIKGLGKINGANRVREKFRINI